MACLDTSFLVDLIRGKEQIKTLLEELIKRKQIITIASPSLMELMSSASLNQKRDEKKEIIDILSSMSVLSLDAESAIKAGEIEAKLIISGETIPSTDIMIAAIAMQNNETLVTKNKKHFSRIKGIEVVDY